MIDAQDGKVEEGSLIKDAVHRIDQRVDRKEDINPNKLQGSKTVDKHFKQLETVDSVNDFVKDITVDDANYELEKESDQNAVKDIVVDDGDAKLDCAVLPPSDPQNMSTEKMIDASRILDHEEYKSDKASSSHKKLDPLTSQNPNANRQKLDKPRPPSPRKQPTFNAKQAVDSVAAKQKIKQQETHGTSAKQPKWIPSNKGRYTDSMHVIYPRTRIISAPASLGIAATSKDSAKASSVAAGPGDVDSDGKSSEPVDKKYPIRHARSAPVPLTCLSSTQENSVSQTPAAVQTDSQPPSPTALPASPNSDGNSCFLDVSPTSSY